MFKKNLIVGIGIIFIFVFVLAGAYFVVYQKIQCAGTPKESLDCFNRYYTEMTDAQGASFALSDLEKRSDKIGIDCHQVAHAIGRATIQHYDTIGEAFKNGSNICMSGFYHGIMEGYSQNMAKPILIGVPLITYAVIFATRREKKRFR